MELPFHQIDVFTPEPFRGNPVAVVHSADDLTTEQMRRIAVWTNLSETTFLLAPADTRADYRVRIFSLETELPFAGHPTLGTCHAWLVAGGVPADREHIIQECELGLIDVRNTEHLGFAAPERRRSGPVDAVDLTPAIDLLGLDRSDVVEARWCDNGPGWIGLLLRDANAVDSLSPPGSHDGDVKVGVVAPAPAESEVDFEVRAFFPAASGTMFEDPVTGSFNAALAQWLFEEGRVDSTYVAAQGTAMGRAGRVHVERDDAGKIWIGGGTVTTIAGTITI